jgi:hypothetical protein
VSRQRNSRALFLFREENTAIIITCPILADGEHPYSGPVRPFSKMKKPILMFGFSMGRYPIWQMVYYQNFRVFVLSRHGCYPPAVFTRMATLAMARWRRALTSVEGGGGGAGGGGNINNSNSAGKPWMDPEPHKP